MHPDAPRAASALLFKGGPSLVDLLVEATELRIVVTGPRMLFERLRLVTTLTAFDGCTAQALGQLAGSLEGSIHCGLIGVQHAPITVESLRSGAALEIGLGPPSMYQSELILRTRTGETFQALIRRLLSRENSRPFFVGLYPLTAEGHLEQHHGHGGGHGGHGGGEHGGGHDHGGHDHGGGHGHGHAGGEGGGHDGHA